MLENKNKEEKRAFIFKKDLTEIVKIDKNNLEARRDKKHKMKKMTMMTIIVQLEDLIKIVH